MRRLPTKHLPKDVPTSGVHARVVKAARRREAQEAFRIEEANGPTTYFQGDVCGDGIFVCSWCLGLDSER